MSDVTVKQFAEVLKVTPTKLLEQLAEAGVALETEKDIVSDETKMTLLQHLRKSHGRADSKSISSPKKITLKRKSQSELKLAGSQGRARTVNVEVRRKRTYIKRDVLEEEAKQKQDELENKRQELERDREAARRKLEESRLKREESTRLAKEAEEKRQEDIKQAEVARKEAETKQREREQKKKEEQARAHKDKKSKEKRSATKYGRAELHVASDKSGRRRRKSSRRSSSVNIESEHKFEAPTAPIVRVVDIPETITVAELAQRLAIKATELIKSLMGMGVMATINQVLDQDTATLLVEEMGHTPNPINENEEEEAIMVVDDSDADAQVRPPVVTIMGHVDHGKTSLLDYIRRTKVTDAEAGGITQHIGAYHVETPKGVITFLDTPGHAAFTAMRARGADVTDIVILVVAADDGVMPQTVEAIQHAKAAGVPLIIAVNKIDKEEADPDRVKNELSQYEVIPEDWGGENIFVHVSAITGEGVDDLLESISLQAELLELSAVAEGRATGSVLETRQEKGRGTVVTILVQRGELKVGESVLVGKVFGRIRAMFDENGNSIETAGPSIPVAVLGLSEVPDVGDDFVVVENERKAREIAAQRYDKQRDLVLAKQQKAKLDSLFTHMDDTADVLNLMIKADTQGSAEALKDAVNKLSTEEVAVNVLASNVGGITESDVNLAAASNAIMIGFNVRADASARKALKETGVDLNYYSIIYEAIDQIKDALSGMLSPEIQENIVGLAEVRDVFRSPKFGDIAGCMVTEGYVKRNLPIRVLRDNVVIYEGELESLRRFKDDVAEVRSGTECGIGVKNYNDVKAGDQIECFERKEVKRSL
ncbi:MAG: translation initiation factor IF-2 [Gammaproteobacteria bacterium]|nr:translation initiation factor IF-2 [Gammaproteobacteria bacterium]NNC97027.1 translation initiation factor IF-2 [Gammaproteobacteria bacterium]NNM13867.1 translation initiation factor IF-2 [Gammaproteobacteria bacterium]